MRGQLEQGKALVFKCHIIIVSVKRKLVEGLTD
jgi:hypothetical protein